MNQNPRVALYCDPPSHHFLSDRFFVRDAAGHGGDQLMAPYAHLRDFLNARNVPVHTIDYLPSRPDGTRNIYLSFGRLSNYRELANRPDTVLSAFFAMECPTVDPHMYRDLHRAQDSFKRILSWSDSPSLQPFAGGALRCLPLHWPQSFESVHETIWNRTDRRFLVMINGNKIPRYRSHCRELYSERLRAIEYFARTGDIDLYGIGWDGPPYRVGRAFVPGTFRKVPLPATVQGINRKLSAQWQRLFPDPQVVAAQRVYRGVTNSKSETLGQYKFSICFENSVLRGWVTEKIFDCFFAGTIPIYWGAPNIEDYIPGECFIDMRRFQNFTELKGYLKSLTDRDIAAFKESARSFLRSPRFRPFTKQAFAELILRIIEEDSGVTLDSEPMASTAS